MAGRRACRPLQDMEETDAEETPPISTKIGIIGMRATAADLMYRSGTPARGAQQSAAREIIRKATCAASTTNMWPQDGTPARPKCTKNICPSQEQNTANDWQARGVVIIIIIFYVKNMKTPRDPLKIVKKIGRMMKQLCHQIATKTKQNMKTTARKMWK